MPLIEAILITNRHASKGLEANDVQRILICCSKTRRQRFELLVHKRQRQISIRFSRVVSPDGDRICFNTRYK
jgi:hypothetical protein